MSPKILKWSLAGPLIIAAVAVLILVRSSKPSDSNTETHESERFVLDDSVEDPNNLEVYAEANEQQFVSPRELLNNGITELEQLAGQKNRWEHLKQLKEQLLSANKEQSVAALRDFLNSDADVGTQLNFRPGVDGFLKSWNSMRVFALDILSILDGELAAQIGQEMLQKPVSSAERILALKLIAQFDPDSVNNNPQWEENLVNIYQHIEQFPKVDHALLYGLDLLVFANQSEHFALLEQLSTNSKFARAAKLASINLLLENPDEHLLYLNENPHLLAKDPQFKAHLFSYTDPQSIDQMNALESFLAKQSSETPETLSLLNTFPNHNRSFSVNLLTQSKIPSMLQIKARDQAAFEVVSDWIRTNRFPRYREQLEKTRKRLKQFAEKN